MVLVANPKSHIVNESGAYIVNKIQDAITAFREELDINTKFSASYIASRDGLAKTNIDDAIAMIRWLYETEFGLTPPPALTDIQVDAINPNIRQYDDSL
jgi:hypothetical protein